MNPAGIVAYNGRPHTDLWFATRMTGITATDAAKIVTGKYGGALAVYADKTGVPEPWEDKPAAKLGTDLEPAVADLFARDMNCHVEEVPIIRSGIHSWALASLDRLAYRKDWDAPRLVEIKCRGINTGTWDEVPDDVMAQVQWQFLCAGLDDGYVALAVTGRGLSIWPVQRDQALIDWIVDQCFEVWMNIKFGVEPDAPADSVELLDRLHPDRAGVVELDSEAEAMLTELRQVSADANAAYARKKTLQARLVQRLGDADTATLGGRKAFTYHATKRTDLDTKALRAEIPDVATRYTRTTTVRTFRHSSRETA